MRHQNPQHLLRQTPGNLQYGHACHSNGGENTPQHTQQYG